jgi:hypothetical protein
MRKTINNITIYTFCIQYTQSLPVQITALAQKTQLYKNNPFLKGFYQVAFFSFSPIYKEKTNNFSLDISNIKIKTLSKNKENTQNNIMYDRAVKNFIKLVTKGDFNPTINNYNSLLTFLKNFDSDIKLSRSSFHNYRNRDTHFKPFIIITKIKDFIKYIQKFDKDFKADLINVNDSLKIKSNKKFDTLYMAPNRRYFHSSFIVLNKENLTLIVYNNPQLSLIVYIKPKLVLIVYIKPKLALIVYIKPKLALIVYIKPKLALIKNINRHTSLLPFKEKLSLIDYVKPNLALTLYTITQLPLILYNKPQLSLINLFKIKRSRYGWSSWMSELYYNMIMVKTLRIELTLFWNYLFNNYDQNSVFAIIFKIRFKDNLIKSVSTTQLVNKTGFNKVLEIFSKVFFVDALANYISETEEVLVQTSFPYGQIIFEYKFLKNVKSTKYEHYNILKADEIIAEKSKKFKSNLDDLNFHNYKNFKIPTHMDLTLWPNIRFSENYNNAYSYVKITNENNEDYSLDFIININEFDYFITVKRKDTILFTVEDYMKNHQDLSEFKRIIKDNEDETHLHYENNVVKLYTKKIKTKFIDTISKDLYKKIKMLTLDFETRDVPTSHSEKDAKIIAKKVPIAVSVFDGKNCYSCIFQNVDRWQDELYLFFKKNFLKRKYDYYKIYIHNASYFDNIFLTDTLTKLGDVKILLRENKFLKITLKFATNINSSRKTTLTFYDSMLILPLSLKDLGKGFKIETQKTNFPFNFMNNSKLDFNYKGPVPKEEDFLNTITSSEYQKYCEKYSNIDWIFKDELIKYCEQDTIVLYKILEKFHNEIYSMFKIDFSKYPTLPALSFGIYRANFMPKNTIAKILGSHHYSLKKGYYGGITEAYKPYGKSIKSYDVNSLYPSVMHDFEMPVGKPIYFLGDIHQDIKEKIPFGFFRVKVEAPIKLLCPALPLKFKTSQGKRTIFPVGKWESWYFSEEIRNKLQYGYKFEILEGYLFNKKNIFYDFIELLYKIKSSYNSDEPKYIISKLLMNSLYGRFGLNPEERETVIASDEESEYLMANKKQVTIVPLLSGSSIVSYEKETDDISIENISVPISAAISAYSRNVMTHYLMKYTDNIYSIDTDGIKIDCELSEDEIDNKKLGKMKYEYEFSEAVFPAPKIYGGLLTKPYKKYKDQLVKVKGLKNVLDYWELKTLLKKNAVILKEQEKWRRQISESTILVRKEIYTLTVKETKREIRYSFSGNYVRTFPFIIINNKIWGT